MIVLKGNVDLFYAHLKIYFSVFNTMELEVRSIFKNLWWNIQIWEDESHDKIVHFFIDRSHYKIFTVFVLQLWAYRIFSIRDWCWLPDFHILALLSAFKTENTCWQKNIQRNVEMIFGYKVTHLDPMMGKYIAKNQGWPS